MSEVIQQLLANPSAFLPEGYQWSEYVAVQDISDKPEGFKDVSTPGTSPCCNAGIGGVMMDTSVIGLCRGCGHVVGEFDVVQRAVRVAEKRAEVVA